MNNSFIELISRVDTVKVESVNLKTSQYKLSKLKLKEKWKEKKKTKQSIQDPWDNIKQFNTMLPKY